jgi:putative endonuclease
MAHNRLIGNKGEDIACEWLKKRNFLIIDRNYLKKWGEIDIVATKDKIIHFVEVKSVTGTGSGYRPEENVHEMKTRRLKRVIQSYLLERKYGLDAEFKFHVITVYMNNTTKRASVNFLENIIL